MSIPPVAEEFVGLPVVIYKEGEKLIIGRVVSAVIDSKGLFATCKIANHHIGARVHSDST